MITVTIADTEQLQVGRVSKRMQLASQIRQLLQTSGKVVRFYEHGTPEEIPQCDVVIVLPQENSNVR